MKTLVIFAALLLALAAGRRLAFKNQDDHPRKATRLRQFEDDKKLKELFR